MEASLHLRDRPQSQSQPHALLRLHLRAPPKRAMPQVVWLLLGILGVTVALGAVGAVYVRQHWVDILAGLAAADDTAKPGHYPKKYAETFVNSCTDAAKAMKDRAHTYCQCFIDEAEPTIKYEDFVRHTLTMASTHKTPPELQPILDACVKKAFGTPQNDERVGTQE